MDEEPRALPEVVDNLYQVSRVLSDKTRVRIVLQLARRAMSVSDLCKALSLPQHAASRHLGVLWMRGIVARHRDGKWMVYSVKRGVFKVLARQLISYFGSESA